MLEVLAALEEFGKVEKNPSMEGKRMTAIVAYQGRGGVIPDLGDQPFFSFGRLDLEPAVLLQ